MNSLPFLLAPFALLLPAVAGLPTAAGPQAASDRPAERNASTLAPISIPADPFDILDDARQVPRQAQVRIEQRVIIRIAPSAPGLRERLLADVPRRQSRPVYQEQKMDGCVAIDSIAAVEPAADNRLLLLMRDRRVLSAALERSCIARDFYSGFYVERNKDGQLCSRRDKLQSRAGASCEVAQLNRLVAVRD